MTEQTKERLRVDGMRLWLGAIFIDKNGDKWIYVGQSQTVVGENANFYPAKYPDNGMVWRCAFRDTLEGKFVDLPDLKYGKVEETGWGEYELKRQMHLGKPIMTQHCHIETNRQCGCGFGQCARGLIY